MTDPVTVGTVLDALDQLVSAGSGRVLGRRGTGHRLSAQPVHRISYAVDCTAEVIEEARGGGRIC